jgi:predicted permease
MGLEPALLISRISHAIDLTGQFLKTCFRGMRRNPAFSAGVALTLSLGIGVNSVMFGALDRILLSPPPHVREPDNIQRIYVERELGERRVTGVNYADAVDLQSVDGIVGTASYTSAQRFAMGDSHEIVRTQLVGSEFFPLLGTIPERGTLFGSADGAPVESPVAVISNGFWRREFGSSENVLGRTLRLAGREYEIIGVAPPQFSGIDITNVDVWLPIDVAGDDVYQPGWRTSRSAYFSRAFARLVPGANPETVAGRATTKHRAFRADLSWYHPESAEIVLAPIIAARGPLRNDAASVSLWLAGVAAAVLLIACANVAGLFLARAETRRREIAVRLALGASRSRLIVSLVGEGAGLGLAAGALALGATVLIGDALYAYLLPSLPGDAGVLSPRVLTFLLAAAVGSGALASLVPAWLASRYDVLSAVKAESNRAGYRRSLLQSSLVVTQVALSVVLLIGAGLFVKSFRNVGNVDLGFDVERLLVAQIASDVLVNYSSSDLEDATDAIPVRPYFDAVERARSVPGVRAAGLSGLVPFYSLFSESLEIPGREEQLDSLTGGVYVNPVDAGYFAAAGLRAVEGRLFLETDDAGRAPVGLVSRRFAREIWGGDSPLGECILVGNDDCTEIVGVVEDTRQSNIEGNPTQLVYVPAVQRPDRIRGPVSFRFPPAILVSAEAGTEAAVRAALRGAIDPVLPEGQYSVVRDFEDLLDSRTRAFRMGSTIFTWFGALALLVAAVGLYTVLSYRVSRRRHELGVRSALGAKAIDQLKLMGREGFGLTGVGIALGLAVAVWLAPKAEDLLFGVNGRDLTVGLGVVVGFLATGAIATLVPALRAVRADPNVALRGE